jgi:hypothetical protein
MRVLCRRWQRPSDGVSPAQKPVNRLLVLVGDADACVRQADVEAGPEYMRRYAER